MLAEPAQTLGHAVGCGRPLEPCEGASLGNFCATHLTKDIHQYHPVQIDSNLHNFRRPRKNSDQIRLVSRAARPNWGSIAEPSDGLAQIFDMVHMEVGPVFQSCHAKGTHRKAKEESCCVGG